MALRRCVEPLAAQGTSFRHITNSCAERCYNVFGFECWVGPEKPLIVSTELCGWAGRSTYNSSTLRRPKVKHEHSKKATRTAEKAFCHLADCCDKTSRLSVLCIKLGVWACYSGPTMCRHWKLTTSQWPHQHLKTLARNKISVPYSTLKLCIVLRVISAGCFEFVYRQPMT